MAGPISVDIDGLRTWCTERYNGVEMYRNNAINAYEIWLNGAYISSFQEYVPALQLFRHLGGKLGHEQAS